MKRKYKGLSRKAKWLVNEDRLITVDGTDVPIIALSQAFGRTTVTYGSIDNPQQQVFNNDAWVVVDEKTYKSRVKTQ